jgi:hypothetical protein
MKEETRSLELNPYEYGVVFHSLNDMRNSLIEGQRPTHIVDELLLKVIDAPATKKGKVRHENR